MRLQLDYRGGEPIYRQIVEQIKYRVACGQVAPGEKLPTIRDLASQLKINTRTVIRAYEELQHAGLVVMRHGQGVFVSEDRDTVPASVRRKTLETMARRLLAEASRLGADEDEVVGIIRGIAEQMENRT